ncbi:MAG: hypothetical protein RIF36_14690 [Imperialibacter sp.]|uniref:ImmA/IrrE family metallo-endopeptidase n=1 Tax=Imperialibacter sp. TaxID=2038411 RepID=UPI0032F05CD3
MKHFLALLLFGLSACNTTPTTNTTENPGAISPSITKVKWRSLDTLDVAGFNADLIPGKPTVDVGVYFPSNFDSRFKKVTLPWLMESLRAAKEIYQPTGVQINLLWVKTGEVDPKHFSIQANEVPGIPETEYVNMYVHSRRHPAELTQHSLDAFNSIIEDAPDNKRTVYLVVLQDVFFPFLEVSEGRNWTMKSVRTGGLSFPGYSYCNTLPSNMRGVITITNLSTPERLRRTVAHELGHKVMNVSHEYKSTHPGHEVYADGGLMLYGDGEDIPSGEAGRWHLERLLLSPYLYKADENGNKTWNPDYKEGGHYYDPLYGDYVVRFDGAAPIDGNW